MTSEPNKYRIYPLEIVSVDVKCQSFPNHVSPASPAHENQSKGEIESFSTLPKSISYPNQAMMSSKYKQSNVALHVTMYRPTFYRAFLLYGRRVQSQSRRKRSPLHGYFQSIPVLIAFALAEMRVNSKDWSRSYNIVHLLASLGSLGSFLDFLCLAGLCFSASRGGRK